MKKRLSGPRAKTLLVINTGTFCDGSLMEDALKTLQNYNIIYVTDEKLVPNDKNIVHKLHTYRTPPFVYMDPSKGAADPTRSVLAWAMAHPVYAKQVNGWISMLGEMIYGAEKMYSPDCVLVNFSLTAALLAAERQKAGVLGTVPHVMLYFIPGVPNASIPWLFDGRLRLRDFKLYEDNTADIVLDSWKVMLHRFSMTGNLSENDESNIRSTSCSLRDIHHALCWDPSITCPLRELVPGLATEFVGSLVDKTPPRLAHRRLISDGVREFLDKNKKNKVAFISFGSVGHDVKLRSIMRSLFAELPKYGYAILFHDTSSQRQPNNNSFDSSASILVHHGHIPYDVIVPVVNLVVFTGTLCLHLKCLLNIVPMLFVPLMTEQYFWAKNYEHFTGITYVDVNEDYPDVQRALKDISLTRKIKKAARYMAVVRQSMLRSKSDVNFKKMISRVITDYRKKKADKGLVSSDDNKQLRKIPVK
jgi:hypothetical protein